mgnify:CR=1 FL=1
MAKVQNPVIGRTKGSAGGMTFSKGFNKNLMRAKVFEPNNPKTAAQTNQRTYFGTVTEQIAGFTPDQLRMLFPKMPKGMSRRNALTKQFTEFYKDVNGQKTMDLAELTTVGNATTMDFGTTTCAIATNKINVNLDAAVKADNIIKNNYFMAIIINDTKNLVVFPLTNNKVETGTLEIDLPKGWENTDTVHAIPLITDSLETVTSFGSLAVTERPARVRNPRP